jgi:hypothetical protein
MRKGICRRLMDIVTWRVLASVGKGVLLLSLVAIGYGQTPSPTYKAIGTVVSVDPTGFTLQTDSGTHLTVLFSNQALLLRVPPNEKTLKNATKINPGDISVGDRIQVRGHISDDQKTLLATAAIVMSKVDIGRKQEAERAD